MMHACGTRNLVPYSTELQVQSSIFVTALRLHFTPSLTIPATVTMSDPKLFTSGAKVTIESYRGYLLCVDGGHGYTKGMVTMNRSRQIRGNFIFH